MSTVAAHVRQSSRLPELIVRVALMGIAQHFVGLGDVLKVVLGPALLVGMVLEAGPPVQLLQLFRTAIPSILDAQPFVQILALVAWLAAAIAAAAVPWGCRRSTLLVLVTRRRMGCSSSVFLLFLPSTMWNASW
jgi:hypothetical protein